LLATAILVTTAPLAPAHASTVCFSPAAGCSLGTEQKIFVDHTQTGVTAGFADVGSQSGPAADFTSTLADNFSEANGFANVKPAKTTNNGKFFIDLSFFIPGHTFTDFEYDLQMASKQKSTSFTVEAFGGKTGTTLEGTHTYTGNRHDADLSFFLASTTPLTKLVWLASVGSLSPTRPSGAGFKEMKHFEVSGVAAIAATPLPAALPLFMSGLGLLGWMGMRKRSQPQG
jgi:hypothetical protein